MSEICDLIADVLGPFAPDPEDRRELAADAILAHPDIKAIIDLAAWYAAWVPRGNTSPEVRRLLADWRAER